jgi:hypothetical protein
MLRNGSFPWPSRRVADRPLILLCVSNSPRTRSGSPCSRVVMCMRLFAPAACPRDEARATQGYEPPQGRVIVQGESSFFRTSAQNFWKLGEDPAKEGNVLQGSQHIRHSRARSLARSLALSLARARALYRIRSGRVLNLEDLEGPKYPKRARTHTQKHTRTHSHTHRIRQGRVLDLGAL